MAELIHQTRAHDGDFSFEEKADMLFKMLSAARRNFPQGLPDKELQRVFELHQSWQAGLVSCPMSILADREEVDNQASGGLHRPRLRLVSASR